MTERETETPGIDVPPEDAFEQRLDVAEDEPEEEVPPPGRPDEADPADRAEQARVVSSDEDEYR